MLAKNAPSLSATCSDLMVQHSVSFKTIAGITEAIDKMSLKSISGGGLI
jgi:hypothetical protein